MEIEKVAFVGCGALGIMYASQMLQTLFPDQVQFIADPDRVSRYRDTEFSANGERQTFCFVSSEDDQRPCDLLILSVKSYGLQDAIRVARTCVDEHTLILSFLNGISSEQIIGRTYDPAQVIPCFISGTDATRTGYAVHFTQRGFVAFGAGTDTDPAALEVLARFFDRVHLDYHREPDITKSMWWKYMLNIGLNQTSALLRAPYGLFQNSSHAQAIMDMAMREVCAVAAKQGIELGEDDRAEVFNVIRTLSPSGKTSMCQDIEAGRPLEVDIFAGELIELAKQQGVPVPVNEFLCNALKALESQAPV